MDIGLYSLFGQYDRFLLKNYDLFFLDGTQGGTDLNLAAVYDNFESYMKPILKQNSQKLKLRQGGFSGYRLACLLYTSWTRRWKTILCTGICQGIRR